MNDPIEPTTTETETVIRLAEALNADAAKGDITHDPSWANLRQLASACQLSVPDTIDVLVVLAGRSADSFASEVAKRRKAVAAAE